LLHWGGKEKRQVEVNKILYSSEVKKQVRTMKRERRKREISYAGTEEGFEVGRVQEKKLPDVKGR